LKGFSLFDWDLFLKTSLAKAVASSARGKKFFIVSWFLAAWKSLGPFYCLFCFLSFRPEPSKKKKIRK
jgi:hypothetical protein